MKLYFIRSNGEKRIVNPNIKEEQVMKAIYDYVASLNPNYKIYYTRCWEEENGIMYDVGSHTEFFFLEK